MKPARIIFVQLLAVASFAAEPWTLDFALTFARTNAPDARIARHRITAAQAALQQANAAFCPTLQAQSSYNRTDNPVGVFGMALNQRSYSTSLDFNNVPDADNLNVRGRMMLPLYAGGRNVAARKAAKAETAAAREEAEMVRNTLEFEVVRVFHTIQKTRRFVEAAESAVRAYETNHFLAERRFDAGTLLKTEVLDLQVRLGQAREDFVRANNAAALSLRAFSNLLGLENAPVEVSESFRESAVPSMRETSRPELRAIQARIEQAEAEVRRAKGGYLPRIDAFGQVDYDAGWKLNGSGKSYAAGVVAQWDLWDGQLTRGRVSQAQAELEAIREQERKLRFDIELETEEARLRLEEANQRLTVTEQTVLQAEESVSLTRARFEQGLALSSQLIDAQTALTSARVRRAEAEADRRIAIAALRKALGLPQEEN